MRVPFDALPRIAAELSRAQLRGPEPDRITRFAATTNPGLVRTRVRRWSGSGVAVEWTEQVYAFSERGEPATEDSSWSARIEWENESVTLWLDESVGRVGAAARALGANVYRFSGDRERCDALERHWLAIIERDFFAPRWPDHRLVPTWFRRPLANIALATPRHRGTLDEIGRQARAPALFHTDSDPAWGMIVSGEQALALGPLPRAPHTFVVHLERPSGAPRREALAIFQGLLGDAPRVEQAVAESGNTSGMPGCVSLSRQRDRVKYSMWRGSGWIIRSQLGFDSASGRSSRHGAFELEWAIQSERGSFALFARQTQARGSDQERLSLCVVARWPRWTFLRHVRKLFVADGWTWMKLYPASFWW